MSRERPSDRLGVVIVGDEILSGHRHDRHLQKSIEAPGEHGLELAWSMMAWVLDSCSRNSQQFLRDSLPC